MTSFESVAPERELYPLRPLPGTHMLRLIHEKEA